MKMGRLGEFFLAILILAGAVACGGGTVAEGGIGGTGITGGTVTGFGSIFVNGVEFDTRQADITVDGQPAAGESALGVGMFVKVYGSKSADGLTGVADRVEFVDELEGVVREVTALAVDGTGTVDVMGQMVSVSRDTVFVSPFVEVPSINYLAPDMVVEVSGYPHGNGEISATRVEVKSVAWSPGSTVLELKGIISDLPSPVPLEGSFTLGGTPVRYDAATKWPAAGIGNGLYVEVQSTLGFNVDGELLAAAIELENGGVIGVTGNEDEHIELQGIVTAPLDANSVFRVNGQPVRFIDGVTGGATQGELNITGTALEVEGTIQNGILSAQTIEFERESEVEVEAPADLNGADRTITLLGLIFHVTNRTILPDDTASEDFWQLPNASVYSVQGYRDHATGALMATHVERDDGELVELEGPVTVIDESAQTLEVYGLITVDTTDAEFVGVTGLSELVEGTSNVHVTGRWDGTAITAITISVETETP